MQRYSSASASHTAQLSILLPGSMKGKGKGSPGAHEIGISEMIVSSPPMNCPNQRMLRCWVTPQSQPQARNLYRLHGVSYSTSTSTKFRDSNIIFSSPASNDSSSRAGSVEVIFWYTYSSAANQEISEYFLAIREYLLMDGLDGLVDIYRTFGFAGGYLCQPHAETLYVICLSNLVSHFALMPIQLRMTEVIHILPVDRVWPSIIIPVSTY